MAVVDAAISVTTKIAEFFLPRIGRRLGYFVHYNRKIEKLRNEVRGLEMKRNEVRESVAEATRNGKVIKPDVEEWLTSVNNTITEANAILVNEVRWFNIRSRYRSGERAERKAEFILELQDNGVFNRVWLHPPPPDIESMSTGAFFAFQSRDLDFREVMKALKDEHTNIIGISGMGGVGKTKLVMEVGKHAKRDQLFDKVLMADVSRDPNDERIQDEIASMLDLKFEERSSKKRRADMLSRRLMEEGKRFLLILDDVWEELALAPIGIPSTKSHKQLKIMLTTRRGQVCQVMDCQRQINLEVLPEEDSWSLFKSNVGNVVDAPNLNGVPREVCRQCSGLPIALVTVGKALRNNDDLREWDEALYELRHAAPINIEGVNENVYACLKWSYNYLKSEEAKQIFLLCCLFPEDHDIEEEMLVYYAVGKGTFQHRPNSIEELRNRVHTIIKQLQASSLLLRGQNKECVKMHDVIRDVAISIASRSEKDKFFIKASNSLKEWPRDVASECEDFTAISLIYNEIKELHVGLKFPKLKILSLRGNRETVILDALTEIPDTFFEGMTSLEVLDLNSVYMSLETYTSIEFPRKLRVLIWSSFVGESMFGKLRHLEMLDLRGNRIGEVPKEIGQLNNLRLLNLRGCGCSIKIAPSAISCLSRLEELYLDWDGCLGEEAVDWFDQLKLLSCLNILYVRIPEFGTPMSLSEISFRLSKFQEVGTAMGFSDIRFHLSKFQVSFGNLGSTCITLPLGRETPLMDGINAFLEQTKYLRISQPLNSFRNFLFHLNENSIGLKCLKNLVLENCHGIEHLINVLEPIEYSQLSLCSLPAIGCLWKLRELSILKCDALEEVFDLNDHEHICAQEGDAFPPLPSLTRLYLSSLPRLQTIWKGPTQYFRLHNLRNVDVLGCPRLRYLFSRDLAGTLLQLEDLVVSKCDALEEVFDLNDHENICAQEGDAFPPLSRLTTLDLYSLPRLQTIWKGPTQFFRLHKLRKVNMSGCPRLRYLFSHDLAGTLLQLEELVVSDCKELEEVVEWKVMVDKIVFPSLKSITLNDLPSLLSFCSRTVPSEFPSLSEISIVDCPNLKIFASGFQSTQDRIHVIYREYGRTGYFYVEDPNVAIQNFLDRKKVETNTSECHRTEEEEADYQKKRKRNLNEDEGNLDEGSSSGPTSFSSNRRNLKRKRNF